MKNMKILSEHFTVYVNKKAYICKGFVLIRLHEHIVHKTAEGFVEAAFEHKLMPVSAAKLSSSHFGRAERAERKRLGLV